MEQIQRYDRTAMALHWLVALLILALTGLGWYMVGIPKGTPPVKLFYNLHKSIGIVAGLLIAGRIAWRIRHRPPAPPFSLPKWQIVLADIGHRLLYVSMVVMPLSGFIASNFRKTGIIFFGMQLPPLGWEDKEIYSIFNLLHVCTSYVLVTLIALHLLAALKHALDRDGVIRRMLPARR
jgi:cytochrome b561